MLTTKMKKSEKSPLLFGKTVIEYIYKMKKINIEQYKPALA